MVLGREQKAWVKTAYEKGFTLLEVKKKLQENKYTDEKIDEMIKEYEKVREGYTIKETPQEMEKKRKEEKVFEGKVKEFLNNEDSSKLTWSERRSIKKFLSNVDKYQKIMVKTIEMIKKEISTLSTKIENKEKYEKEIEWLKKDIIHRIIESKEILDIEHPVTGEEVNEKNLQTLSIDELILLMEENVNALQIIVNGKISD